MDPNMPETKHRSRRSRPVVPLFAKYEPRADSFDEVFNQDRTPRRGLEGFVRLLGELGEAEFGLRQRLADGEFLRRGITFSVYEDSRGVEKIFPFDLIPRPVSATEWRNLERGLTQRIQALNAFLADIYGEQRILRDKRIPREIVEESVGYLPVLRGIRPPKGVYVHVSGIDLIRGPDGEFVVLEDNLCTPSGASYVLENRIVMKHVLPRIFREARVRAVDEYPLRLHDALAELSPNNNPDPRIVVLTPGPYNSAYFEHSFLARRMGCELVHGSDLVVDGDRVFMKTTTGPIQVDVIYRRINDQSLDPEVFRKDSLLGIPGLIRAYAAGNVTIANAPGNGVADDKAVYPFVPEMIRFYLTEEPILGQVETLICAWEPDRKEVLDNLAGFVVKSVNMSGGYGMLIGPKASRAQRDEFAKLIRDNPRGYIAQPLVELSSCPTWTKRGAAPRRVDLRPYAVTGLSTWVMPGGLTRVALNEGSYVVNSSQGGGSKDTWVLEESTT